MDLVYNYGQMVQNMKESGRKIRLMGRGNFGMLMVIFSMVNGKMIKQMVMEFIHM
jgi:hypothetical protein